MTRLTDGGIDSFCSKLGQSDLKELVKVYDVGIVVILCTGQGQGKSRKVTEGHFLLRGYATHDLGVIFYAGYEGHGYIFPKLTFLIISVYFQHKQSFIPYFT